MQGAAAVAIDLTVFPVTDCCFPAFQMRRPGLRVYQILPSIDQKSPFSPGK